MDLTVALDFFSVTAGLLSGIFFAVGVLTVKQETLVFIATKMWGKGKVIATELAEQKAQFIAGAALLFLSFAAQMVVKLLPTAPSPSSFEANWPEAEIGIGAALMLGLLAYVGYRFYRTTLVAAIEIAATEGTVDSGK